MGAYNDETLMPFGKFKGIKLEKVPADYLHWWYTETNKSNKELKDYIEDNLAALKQEYPDGIWK
jgi:uncharacterized protein (DUF3820 family)